MDRDAVLEYCLGKPGAWRDEPWDGDVVAKVDEKIFAFLGTESVGLKCGANRDEADQLVAAYPDDVSKMPYLGRSGWNTVRFGGAVADDEVFELIDASYETVVSKLPKSRRPAAT